MERLQEEFSLPHFPHKTLFSFNNPFSVSLIKNLPRSISVSFHLFYMCVKIHVCKSNRKLKFLDY